MRKSAASGLLAIVLVAIGLRLGPLRTFLYWGADIGEYHAVLRGLVEAGHVSTRYSGWGVTYPYFPGLFFVQDALVEVGRVDLLTVLALVAPVLGALAVLPMFLLAAGIARDARIGLFAAGFLAVAMPHVYATSHTAPSTLGDLLALAGLLVFLRLPRDRRAIVPALLLAGALVVTHHLATYFLILMVVFAAVLRAILRSRPGPRRERAEAATIGLLVAGTFAFWFGSATTFRDGILRDVRVSPWWIIPAAFPAFLVLLVGLVRLRRRFAWTFRPRVPDTRRAMRLFAVTLSFLVAVVVFGVSLGVPGTAIRLPLAALPFFAPLYVAMALSATGRGFLDFHPSGSAPLGWLSALILSIAFGAVAAPQVIIPYRHIEYVVVPLALFAGVGLVRVVDLGVPGRRGRIVLAAGACVLLLGNAVVAVPPPDIIVGWQEGTRPAAVDAAFWTRDRATGLLAADHRASTVAFGFGSASPTWDASRSPFLEDTFAASEPGMRGVLAPSGTADVAYVWVDADTRAGVQLFPWEPAVPMTPAAVAKFQEAPFVKVFDNGYAQLYWVAWGCDPGTC